MPLVLLPRAVFSCNVKLLDVAAPLVSTANVYLFRIFDAAATQASLPNAIIPNVPLPAAAPQELRLLALAAELTTSFEYVYFFLVRRDAPIVKIPLVVLPTADPPCKQSEREVAVEFEQVAKVYLLVVHMMPMANIPKVPEGLLEYAPNPNPCADAAPFEKIVGIRYPHLYWV